MSFFDSIDKKIQESPVGRFFEMKERNACVKLELQGAFATFMSMSYILAVNPRILADSGGPCDPNLEGGIFGDEYSACVEAVKREYITATAIASMLGCFFMGFGANLPIALAPGMGMNAYFTYSVVGFRGGDDIGFDAAVTAILIEGIIFLILALTGLRQFIIKFIPEPVRLATPAAIGAFLAHLGLQTAEGLGIVVADVATSVTIGGCPISHRTPMVQYDELCAGSNVCITSDAYTCDVEGGIMTSGTTWAGIVGLLIMLGMLCYKNRSAFLVGIALVTFVSWFRNSALSYFPDNDLGDDRFEYFKKVVSVEKMDKILVPFTSKLGDAGVALFTFLYVDFLDTSGTLLALVIAMGIADEKGDFPRSRRAFAADACATIAGSFFGLSPVTSYIESAAGVETGSRTGMTAVFCGIFFLLSIFFAPIIASIPPWATGGALVIVGCLMARSLKDVKWHDPAHASTAFLTVIIMPLTYSIAYGLLAGCACWIFLQCLFKLLEMVGIERPVFDEERVTVVDRQEKKDSSEEENVKPDGAEGDAEA
mmetsp:Transcript_3761/g.7475  ORF Transcript_3761/g.7475 Transcript_3761/m.7475 type:complete len:540 (+) Transcript_3761:105-1724(+)